MHSENIAAYVGLDVHKETLSRFQNLQLKTF